MTPDERRAAAERANARGMEAQRAAHRVVLVGLVLLPDDVSLWILVAVVLVVWAAMFGTFQIINAQEFGDLS